MAKAIVAQLEGIHIIWKFLISCLFLLSMFGFVGAFFNIYELIAG